MTTSSFIDIDSDDFKQFEMFLQKHPHVFQVHRRLLSYVTPPSRTLEEKVVDFQKEHISYLKEKNQQLEEVIEALLEGNEDNEKQIVDIHQATLRLLAAPSMEALYQVITEELPDILGIDAVDICLACPQQKIWSFIPYAPAIMINDFFKDQTIILRSHIEDNDIQFSHEECASDALIKIDIPQYHIIGVISFASYQPDTFDETQRTTFLDFLQSIFTHIIHQHAQNYTTYKSTALQDNIPHLNP